MEEPIHPLEILSGQLRGFVTSAIALAPSLAAAVVVLILAWLLAWVIGGGVRRLLRRAGRRPSLVDALGRLAKIGVWALGLLLAATIVFPGLTPTNALAGLGVGSLVIGLAFRDIFENFLAGLLILLRRPMRIGDDISCEGVTGRVEAISMRDTSLRMRSGELVLVPNSFLFKNPVTILTDQQLRRITVTVGVAYGEDVDAARRVILDAVTGLPSVADRPVQVFAREFGESSVDFLVRWWTDSTPPGEHRSRDEVVAAIKTALDGAGIEIPFPYRTLTFKTPLSLDDAPDA